MLFCVKLTCLIKIRKIGANFFALVFLMSLFVLVISLIPRQWGKREGGICERTICITNNRFHADILLPISDRAYKGDNYWHNNYKSTDRYLSFGWGDRVFFRNPPTQLGQQLTLGFKALFLPTPSALRVRRYRSMPQSLEVKCVQVSRSNYLQLIEFIQNSLELDERGKKILISFDRPNGSSFYAAQDTYSFLYNCNSWTAAALRKANINTPLWAGIPAAIVFHLKSNCKTFN